MSTEEETAASGAPRPRGRNAPRHAAPRKPLLTRLHMPAGKAIAIAAMPTAVLMGMGLTPTLAQARPVVPDNPFQDGPCVTAPDTVPAGKSATEAEEKPGAEAGGKSGGKSGTESGEPSGAAATPTPDPATDAPAARSPDARDGDGSRAGKPASGRPEAGKPTGGTTEARGPDAVRTPGRPEPAPAPSPTGDRDRDADEDRDSDRDRDRGSGPGPGPAPTPSAQAREPVTRTSPTPAPARTRLPSHPLDRLNPLDPLGVGRAVEDLLSPLRPRVPAVTGSATPTPTRTPGGHGTGTPERERDDDGDGGDEGEQPDADDEESGTPGTGDPATPTGPAGSAGTTAPDAPDGPAQPDEPTGAATATPATPATPSGTPGATPTPTPTGTPGATPTPGPTKSPSAADPMAPDADGKVPFPCVVERKVAGDAERPPAMIPNQPWHLEASSLLLKGLDYQGVVNLTMPNGRTKQALKFVSADGVDIGDLHQIVDAPGGRKYHVQAGRGTISTIRGGTVTMYTERLEGNLFGLIPVVFDPEHPPPLNIPVAYFTQVRIVQAGQFGGDLTIPQLHQSVTG